MPIIKFYVPEASANKCAIDSLRSKLHQACMEWLRAKPDAVQIMLVPGTRVLIGPPAYIEVLYRDQPYRDSEVMARFMHLLETQTQAVFGFTPRIRCVAIPQSQLYALN